MKSQTFILLSYTFFLMITIGIIFNHITIINNDCKMPINKNSSYETNKHISYKSITDNNQKVNYKLFSDYFKVVNIKTDKKTYNYYFSLGDLMIYSGILFNFLTIILFYIYDKEYV